MSIMKNVFSEFVNGWADVNAKVTEFVRFTYLVRRGATGAWTTMDEV